MLELHLLHLWYQTSKLSPGHAQNTNMSWPSDKIILQKSYGKALSISCNSVHCLLKTEKHNKTPAYEYISTTSSEKLSPQMLAGNFVHMFVYLRRCWINYLWPCLTCTHYPKFSTEKHSGRLRIFIQCWHPLKVPVHALVVPLWIQLPTNGLE